jgi:hypothetical protein
VFGIAKSGVGNTALSLGVRVASGASRVRGYFSMFAHLIRR